MKFGFIAKHREIWPADWLCGALGVSRGGFYAWLKRPRSRRSRSDEELGAKVRASFIASDRTYGCYSACNFGSDAILMTDQLAESVFVESIQHHSVPIGERLLSPQRRMPDY